MKSISIIAWNINGLKTRKTELQVILELINVDVCLINETHLTDQDYCKIKGYCFYHTVHPSNNARGGSGIFIKEHLKHYEDFKIQTESIQLTSITVQTKHAPMKIASIYFPPGKRLIEDNLNHMFKEMGNRYIIGGDFNAKHLHWGSRLTNERGKTLFKSLKDNDGDFISTGKPTHWPTDQNKIPDLIDFFIYKNISENYMMIEEQQDLCSDHTGIVLTISENIITKTHNPVLVNKKNRLR